MKITLLLFVSAIFFLPSMIAKGDLQVPQQETEKTKLTFDGYEGGFYFFTDENKKALTVKAKDETPLHNLDLINDDLIGTQFEVVIEKPKAETPIIPVQNIKQMIAAN